MTFSEPEVYIEESESEVTHATYTLDRRGTDLNINTMVAPPPPPPPPSFTPVMLGQVRYSLILRDGDNATENVDYRLYIHDTCTLMGDTGCVSFAPGDTRATIGVDILPDTLLEGNEVFHIRLVYEMGIPDIDKTILKVTIIDGAHRKPFI